MPVDRRWRRSKSTLASWMNARRCERFRPVVTARAIG
jgi:hypothetical protein